MDFSTFTASVVTADAIRKALITGAIETTAQNVKEGTWTREQAVKAISPIVDTAIPQARKGKGHADRLRVFVSDQLDAALADLDKQEESKDKKAA